MFLLEAVTQYYTDAQSSRGCAIFGCLQIITLAWTSLVSDLTRCPGLNWLGSVNLVWYFISWESESQWGETCGETFWLELTPSHFSIVKSHFLIRNCPLQSLVLIYCEVFPIVYDNLGLRYLRHGGRKQQQIPSLDSGLGFFSKFCFPYVVWEGPCDL